MTSCTSVPNAAEPCIKPLLDSVFATELRAAVGGISAFVLSTTDVRRADRLWPADYTVFATNPMSIAYGACGTALFLHRVHGEIPPAVRRWLLDRPIDVSTYPPGLYIGLAGIAYAFAEIGELDRARAVMRLIDRSPLRYVGATVFQGMAGWGMASLHLFARTGEAEFLSRACQAGDRLVTSARSDGTARYWRDETAEHTELGFAYGASGVALFLLDLFRTTGEPRYLACATAALDFDLGHAKPFGTKLRCSAHTEETGTRPYWLHGTSGLGTALIRFYTALRDERYLTAARATAEGAFSVFTVAPGQFTGMSGIGEFLLDMFSATDEPEYRDRAAEVARNVLCYAVTQKAGIAFPGAQLLRLCNDFGTGSAGVGMFLDRLVNARPRLLHDFSWA